MAKTAIVLMLLIGVAAAQSTTESILPTSTSNTDVPSTTTTETEPTCGPHPLLQTLENGESTGNCHFAIDGDQCAFTCDVGYVANYNLTFVCNFGDWVQVNGEDPTAGMCLDYDKCEDQPCDEFVSVCVDDAAPSLGYTCECKEHHVGVPGTDGKGCSRVTITTEGGNMEIKTGEGLDIGFNIGRDRFTISELSTALDDETERAKIKENNLESALVSSVQTLSNAADAAAESLETRVVSVGSQLTSQIEFNAASLATSIGANGDMIGENGEAITSTLGRVVNVEDGLDAAEVSLANSLNTVKNQLTSTINGVKTSLAAAVGNTQDDVNAVTANLANNYYTSDDVDGLLDAIKNWATGMFTTAAQVSAAHYSKSLSDGRYYTKTTSDSRYYTKTEVNSKLGGYYTKTDSDSRYYTRSQVTSLLGNYYTKTDSDNRYYTRSQVSSLLGNYYTKTDSNSRYYTKTDSDNRYWTRSQADGRYWTQSQADGRYYTQSTMNSRMVFPVNSGATRNMPLLVSSFMGDDDDSGDYLRIYDGAWAVRSTSSALEWYQWVFVPYEWYFYQLAVYGNSNSPDMAVYRRSHHTTSYSVSLVCSSTSINRVIGCNSGTSVTGSSYNFIVYMSGMSTSYYLYGGYYTIRRV